MYISDVRLKNIRGVGARGLVADWMGAAVEAGRGRPGAEMAGWNVVAGPNGSGKTSLLQGMAASLVAGAGSAWLIAPDQLGDWIHRGRWPKPEDEGETVASVVRVARDDGAHPQDETALPVPLQVLWRRGGSIQQVPPPGNHGFLSEHFWNAAAFGARPDGWYFAAYGARRANQSSSSDSQRLFQAAPRTAAMVTLFRDDAGLDAGRQWLIGLDHLSARRGGREAQALVAGLLRLLGDRLLDPAEQTAMRVEPDDLYVNWQGRWQPLRLLGDGYRSTALLVLDMLLRIEQFKPGRLVEEIRAWPTEGPVGVRFSGVVLIDEPEVHLHPELQQRIGFWLKQHFPGMQFIVTTHSPLICQAADAGGLFRMDGGRIHALEPEVWAAVTNGTLDDAVVSGLFGLAHAESSLSRQYRRRLGELEVRRFQGALSAEEEAERREILKVLPGDPGTRLDALRQGSSLR